MKLPHSFRRVVLFNLRERHTVFASRLTLLTSILFLSCNSPFQPEIKYTPRLNVYSILFANSRQAYVRVTSVTKTESGVQQPVHGATVQLFSFEGTSYEGSTLKDTTELINGDTASFYYAPVHIMPGHSYSLSVTKDGYPPVSAYAYVPYSYVTIPDAGTYSILRNPRNIKSEIQFNVSLSQFASADFVQMAVEFRGLDDAGRLHYGSYPVLPIDSLNPFQEIQALRVPFTVDTTEYQDAYKLAGNDASSMKVSHMYADIIVTQVDDNFYRFFITSGRSLDPLVMRTDKIIFSNVLDNAGTGIVSGVSVDTTRIFLY